MVAAGSLSSSTGVAITNPLVLYRSLIATQKLRADPAQHRLALHLQKLYDQLIDYEPTVEYDHKLQQLNQVLGQPSDASSPDTASVTPKERSVPQYTRIGRGRALLNSWLASSESQRRSRESLALTRSLTDHDAAMEIEAPRGLLLHGSVGTGKSMLVDLFAECLPTKRKRRWHYNTFMLNIVSRLETLRRQRLVDDEKRRLRSSSVAMAGSEAAVAVQQEDAHALLWLARELVTTSPVLFLDEFQLPDRMAAKTLSGLLTCFFRLGGVLIATSNRLPDELAKAAGMEYAAPASPGGFMSAWTGKGASKSEPMFAGLGEYAGFLELLKKRCEVWEMEGRSDYRRDGNVIAVTDIEEDLTATSSGISIETQEQDRIEHTNSTHPARYTITQEISSDPASTANDDQMRSTVRQFVPSLASVEWQPTTAIVYGRTIPISRSHQGTAVWTFNEICAAQLGPADYITLASMYHTFIITSVPILKSALKNEARRFITLLDALYEARCKLVISAAAPPDDLFFPDLRSSTDGSVNADAVDDMQAETFSEIHQDLTMPFRPNISSYKEAITHDEHEYAFRADALEDDPPNKMRRAALGDDVTEHERMESLGRWRDRVDFASRGAFIGEDESFAWKRASSRLWEMCGNNWWAKQDWWRPLGQDMRHWEGSRLNVAYSDSNTGHRDSDTPLTTGGEGMGPAREVDQEQDEPLFRHGASPFRTNEDPPPRIQPEHVWGVARWGKRAGAWGKGIDGLQERKKS